MDLFSDEEPASPVIQRAGRASGGRVEPAACDADLQELAARLPPLLHMGTSSWSFPGWKGLVWSGDESVARLSRSGLAAYSSHPLLRLVSLDRAFYRPLSASEYAAHAAQVPEHFRFVVKAPSLVCDALVRGPDGRARQDNPSFLDPGLAVREFIEPALAGLSAKAGALVFQLSPLPERWLDRMDELLDRLDRMLATLPKRDSRAPGAVVAVEVRNPEFLTPAFAAVLKANGATYCLGLHPRMPPVEDQLPVLRALWPGPLVCRWSLNRKHGSFGYEEAKGLYEPFDRLVDADPATRDALARVIAGTAGAGFRVFVTINNKAEGSAPLSVIELGRSVDRSMRGERPDT